MSQPPRDPCAQREFSIAIAPDLRITTESAPAATLATPYALQVGWTGGGNITWAISAGALPPGMTLDQTGLIQGTPTTAGSFTFTLLIKHEFRSDTKNLTLSVRERLAFTVPTDVPAAEVGVPLTPLGLAASGGSEKYTWEIDPATLPAGVAVDAEGKIVGTPRVAGTFPIVVVVKDDEGRSATGQLVITIAPKLAVATRRLPQTKVGKTFKALLRTSGGIAPVRWKAVRGEGRFPPGVRLNKKTGLLVGKPRKPGVYRFMVQATDGFKVTATRKLAIVVKAPPKSKKKQKKTR